MFILCLKFVEQFTYPFSWWICNFVILQERKCMYKLLGNNCSLILSGVPCLNWNKGTDIPYQFISLGGMKYFQLYSRFQINWKLEKHNKHKKTYSTNSSFLIQYIYNIVLPYNIMHCISHCRHVLYIYTLNICWLFILILFLYTSFQLHNLVWKQTFE